MSFWDDIRRMTDFAPKAPASSGNKYVQLAQKLSARPWEPKEPAAAPRQTIGSFGDTGAFTRATPRPEPTSQIKSLGEASSALQGFVQQSLFKPKNPAPTATDFGLPQRPRSALVDDMFRSVGLSTETPLSGAFRNLWDKTAVGQLTDTFSSYGRGRDDFVAGILNGALDDRYNSVAQDNPALAFGMQLQDESRRYLSQKPKFGSLSKKPLPEADYHAAIVAADPQELGKRYQEQLEEYGGMVFGAMERRGPAFFDRVQGFFRQDLLDKRMTELTGREDWDRLVHISDNGKISFSPTGVAFAKSEGITEDDVRDAVTQANSSIWKTAALPILARHVELSNKAEQYAIAQGWHEGWEKKNEDFEWDKPGSWFSGIQSDRDWKKKFEEDPITFLAMNGYAGLSMPALGEGEEWSPVPGQNQPMPLDLWEEVNRVAFGYDPNDTAAENKKRNDEYMEWLEKSEMRKLGDGWSLRDLAPGDLANVLQDISDGDFKKVTESLLGSALDMNPASMLVGSQTGISHTPNRVRAVADGFHILNGFTEEALVSASVPRGTAEMIAPILPMLLVALPTGGTSTAAAGIRSGILAGVRAGYGAQTVDQAQQVGLDNSAGWALLAQGVTDQVFMSGKYNAWEDNFTGRVMGKLLNANRVPLAQFGANIATRAGMNTAVDVPAQAMIMIAAGQNPLEEGNKEALKEVATYSAVFGGALSATAHLPQFWRGLSQAKPEVAALVGSYVVAHHYLGIEDDEARKVALGVAALAAVSRVPSVRNATRNLDLARKQFQMPSTVKGMVAEGGPFNFRFPNQGRQPEVDPIIEPTVRRQLDGGREYMEWSDGTQDFKIRTRPDGRISVITGGKGESFANRLEAIEKYPALDRAPLPAGGAMRTLYHGSNVEGITQFDKDTFATEDRATAQKSAETSAKLSGGKPVVYEFEVPETALRRVPAEESVEAARHATYTITDPAAVRLRTPGGAPPVGPGAAPPGGTNPKGKSLYQRFQGNLPADLFGRAAFTAGAGLAGYEAEDDPSERVQTAMLWAGFAGAGVFAKYAGRAFKAPREHQWAGFEAGEVNILGVTDYTKPDVHYPAVARVKNSIQAQIDRALVTPDEIRAIGENYVADRNKAGTVASAGTAIIMDKLEGTWGKEQPQDGGMFEHPTEQGRAMNPNPNFPDGVRFDAPADIPRGWMPVLREVDGEIAVETTAIGAKEIWGAGLVDVMETPRLYYDAGYITKAQYDSIMATHSELAPYLDALQRLGVVEEGLRPTDRASDAMYWPRGETKEFAEAATPAFSNVQGSGASPGSIRHRAFRTQAEGLNAGAEYRDMRTVMHESILQWSLTGQKYAMRDALLGLIDPKTGEHIFKSPQELHPDLHAFRSAVRAEVRRSEGGKSRQAIAAERASQRARSRTDESARLFAEAEKAKTRAEDAQASGKQRLQGITAALKAQRAVMRTNLDAYEAEARRSGRVNEEVKAITKKFRATLSDLDKQVARLDGLNSDIEAAEVATGEDLSDPKVRRKQRKNPDVDVQRGLKSYAQVNNANRALEGRVRRLVETAEDADQLRQELIQSYLRTRQSRKDIDKALADTIEQGVRFEVAKYDAHSRDLGREAATMQRLAANARVRANRDAANADRHMQQAKVYEDKAESLYKTKEALDRIWDHVNKRAPKGQRVEGLPGMEMYRDLTGAYAAAVNRYLDTQPMGIGEQAIFQVQNGVRTMVAGGDAAAMSIQGILVAYRDPRLAVSATAGALAHMRDGSASADMILKYDKFAKENGLPRPTELAAMGLHLSMMQETYDANRIIAQKSDEPFQKAVNFAETNPYAKMSGNVYSLTGDAIRLGDAYSQLMAFKGTRHDTPEMRRAIVISTNRMTGYADRAFGESLLGRRASLFQFAGRFFQSQLETVAKSLMLPRVTFDGKMPRGVTLSGMGYENARAREGLIRMVGIGSLMTVAANEALGEETDFNPMSPNFMRIRVGGNDVSLFGPWDSLVKGIMRTANGAPVLDGMIPDWNGYGGDMTYIFRAKSAPLISIAWDQIEAHFSEDGKTMWGDDPTSTEYLLSKIMPFSTQAMLENYNARKEGGITKDEAIEIAATGAFSFFGGKSNPMTGYEKFMDEMKEDGIDPHDPLERKEWLLARSERTGYDGKAESSAGEQRDENDDDFMRGTVTQGEWNERETELVRNYVAGLGPDDKLERGDYVVSADGKPREEWVGEYFAIMDRATDDRGQFNGQVYDQLLNDYVEEYGMEALEYMWDYTEVGKSEPKIERMRAMRALNSVTLKDGTKVNYFEIPKLEPGILKVLDEEEAFHLAERVRQARSLERAAGNEPTMSVYDSAKVWLKEQYPGWSDTQIRDAAFDIAATGKEKYQNEDYTYVRETYPYYVKWFDPNVLWPELQAMKKVQEGGLSGQGFDWKGSRFSVDSSEVEAQRVPYTEPTFRPPRALTDYLEKNRSRFTLPGGSPDPVSGYLDSQQEEPSEELVAP